MSHPPSSSRSSGFSRRTFQQMLLSGGAWTWAGEFKLKAQSGEPAGKGQSPPRAPFKLLYNSDTTHILSCTSAWRPDRKEPLRESMFIAAVDEALDAGADAYVIAPGLGWVPWWPSEVLPLAAHCDWFRKQFNLPAASTSFTNYVLKGGDFLKLTIDRCHEKGAACLVSFRMNDVHHKDTADRPKGSHISSVPQFYTDHPEYRLGPQPKETQMAWGQYVHNWAIPEVRDFKFRLIEELCRNYDLDGLELDFYRAAAYFRFQETTREQRSAIMTSFMRQVRQALDEHARPGRRRWLSVRIPSLLAAHDALGIDVTAFAVAGVDIFNLAASYHTEQTTSLAKIRELVPGKAVYLELTPVVSFNGNVKKRSHRRSTKETLTTTAHLAFAQGANGVSLFNFQYYRDYRDPGQEDGDGPSTEPPFELLPLLKDKAALSALQQHYFIGTVYESDPRRAYPFPRVAKAGDKLQYLLDLAPPAQGWSRAGRLRLQSRTPFASDLRSGWRATLNGVPLLPSADVSEPYPTVYTQMQGRPEEWLAWEVPAQAGRAGRNEVLIHPPTGSAQELIGLSLAMG